MPRTIAATSTRRLVISAMAIRETLSDEPWLLAKVRNNLALLLVALGRDKRQRALNVLTQRYGALHALVVARCDHLS